MKNEWFELREKLLFNTSIADFAGECQRVRTKLREEFETAVQTRQEELINILTELSIDMQSYLLRWHLQNPARDEKLEERVIHQETITNYILLEQ